MKLGRIITGNFFWFISGGFLLGICFPTLAAFLNPSILYVLGAVMYLAFLRVDTSTLKREFSGVTYHIYLCFLTLILVPTAAYFAARFLQGLFGAGGEGRGEDLAIGALLLFACPTSVLATTFTLFLNGNFERSIVVLITTSFLAPITLPLVVKLVVGQTVSFSVLRMMGVLAAMILIPFMLAYFTQRLSSNIKKIISPTVPALSLLLLVIVEIGALHGVGLMIEQNIGFAVKSMVIACLILGLIFGLSWFLEFSRAPRDKLTTSLVSTWANLGLSLGLANTFFAKSHPDALLFLVIMVIPWHLSLMVVRGVIATRKN